MVEENKQIMNIVATHIETPFFQMSERCCIELHKSFRNQLLLHLLSYSSALDDDAARTVSWLLALARTSWPS